MASQTSAEASTLARHSPMAWRMVALAFCAQNCASGLTYGSYGTLLTTLEGTFDTSRAVISVGLSAVSLVVGLLSPIVGYLLHRASIRAMMVGGALLNAAAYAGLSQASSIYQVLGLYALIGAGVCMLSVIPPVTLISRWFVEDRGKALGLINMPIFIFLAPLGASAVLTQWGLSTVFLGISAVHVLLSVALLWVRDAPDHVSLPTNTETTAPTSSPLTLLTTRQIFTSPSFWLLTLGVGLLTGGSMAYLVHFVPFATSRSHSLETAAMIISAYGFAGIGGTYVYGWLADKLGATRALAANAFLQTVAWGALTVFADVSILLVLTAVIGGSMTSMVALQGSVFSQVFGAHNVGRVMGLCYFLKIPFNFGVAPLIGLIFDATGSYTAAFLGYAAGICVAGIVFVRVTITYERNVYMEKQA